MHARPSVALSPTIRHRPARRTEIVVTATRVPTPVLDIPAGVSVIDRQTIEQRGYTTLTEALSAIPGVRVSQSGGPGGNASVFVRGTNSNQVLVLRDGMPLNDASDASGAFNFGVDTLADVERIEVIRGPMAALYGSGAIGGVINLISRQGHEPGVHVTGDLAGGYPKQIQGNVDRLRHRGAARLLGDLRIAVAARLRYDATAHVDLYRRSRRLPRPVGTLNLGYTPVEGTRLSLFLRAARATVRLQRTRHSHLRRQRTPPATTFSCLGASASARSCSMAPTRPMCFSGVCRKTGNIPRRSTRSTQPGKQRFTLSWLPHRPAMEQHGASERPDDVPALSATDLTFGYEHIADNVNVKVNQSSFGSPFRQGATASMTDDALYAGLQSELWQRLILTGQLRQDWVPSECAVHLAARCGAGRAEVSTRFKAAYGTAFRAPSLFDRFGVDSFGFIGNPNLKPETAQGWEVGFTTTLAAFARKDFISFGATLLQ